jgi:homoserine kinase type II
VGTFTVLGEAELFAIAQAFGLGSVQRSRAIAAGTINSNYELVTEDGTFFVRVNEGKAEEDVAWESSLVGALAQAGIPTPAPLVARDGRPYAPLPGAAGKWVSAFPWRPGKHVDAAEVSRERAETLGATLARMHMAGLALPAAWRRGSIYDHEHLVARFARIERAAEPQLVAATAILREELAIATEAGPVRKLATHGIIHGDLFRDNVLWDGMQISALLDFEQASGGSLVYDLAVCVNDWCWTTEPRLELAYALIAGYQRVRMLTTSDREALPYEIRAAATRFTITRITDVYLARVTNPEKDFRDFLARVEAWRGPWLGQLTRSV